jgi:hypothetical protein
MYVSRHSRVPRCYPVAYHESEATVSLALTLYSSRAVMDFPRIEIRGQPGEFLLPLEWAGFVNL